MCFSDHRLNLTEEGFSRNETRCRQDASLTEIGWSGSSVHLKKLTPPHLVHGNKIEAGRFRTKKKYQSSLFHSWWFLQNNTLGQKKATIQFTKKSLQSTYHFSPPFRFDLGTIYLVSLPAKWMSPQRTEIISSTLWTSRNMELLEKWDRSVSSVSNSVWRRILSLCKSKFSETRPSSLLRSPPKVHSKTYFFAFFCIFC